MEGGGGGDVDAATEFCFEVGDEASGEEGGAFGAGFDEEIEVTIGAGFASGEGAEDADGGNSVVGGDPEDGGSFGPAEVVEGHGGWFDDTSVLLVCRDGWCSGWGGFMSSLTMRPLTSVGRKWRAGEFEGWLGVVATDGWRMVAWRFCRRDEI